MALRAECLAAVGAELGEGPVWNEATGEVVWVDILKGEVHAVDLEGVDRLAAKVDEPVGAVALDEDGGIVLATPRGLIRTDGSMVAPLHSDASDLRMNDGKPDPAGRFVGGTMTTGDPRPGAGALWSFDGSQPRCLVAGATIANGLAWSADGETLYWIDTPTRRIDAFDYDLRSGLVRNRRVWADLASVEGSPDGMCIDSEGGLWVALWGGSAVQRYCGGRLDEVLQVPTPLVTCPAFAGEDLDLLVVTTASIDFDHPPIGAGDIYVAELGHVGLPPGRVGAWAA